MSVDQERHLGWVAYLNKGGPTVSHRALLTEPQGYAHIPLQ